MDWTDPTGVCLALVMTLLFIMKIGRFWSSSSSSKDIPPGPRPLPIIGNLHIIDLKRPYRTLLELSKTYGPVVNIHMGIKKMVVLSGYETVKEALVNQADAFAERPKIPVFEDFSKGKGIIFSHGQNWKVMRRFALSTLRDLGMGRRVTEDYIVEECGYLIEKFESQKGKPFDPIMIMNGAVGNIIVSIVLGERFGYEDPQFVKLLHLINENVRVCGSPSVMIYNLFPALGFLLKGHKVVLQNRDELHAFSQVTFIEHLRKLDRNDQRSLIDAFLIRQQEEENDTNSYFQDGNLKALITNLFTAGLETTSTTLRWGFLLMMKYPEIQQKVQEEIERVLGSNPPRIEHRSKMPYTDAVVHEIQRFSNILPMDLPHETTMDVTLKGYFIPKGTYIIPLLASVLQDKSQWEKPDAFYPEHFLDAEGKFVKKEAFMPFSAGRRMCAGETLAKMELFLFFASLLQRFTFQPAPGVSRLDLDLTPAVGFTTPPMPHEICAVPRS
ncbi:cytochrome P450 2K6-like [Alligator mississippiensis]|uniref:cytochrome P450 2K6-like n=1 Tax=Alligator mississippiensis TaxID=8496 RepID=UPI0028777B40|nr:cytochrome P450 2K6-like [Alligator mississippiensis]XP_059584750.1 cytochrome P450 2K6-like [Alligator mississippiensis]XP_059584789.1 cytochrome P450 2K6-like [Alligator mississippiensis]